MHVTRNDQQQEQAIIMQQQEENIVARSSNFVVLDNRGRSIYPQVFESGCFSCLFAASLRRQVPNARLVSRGLQGFRPSLWWVLQPLCSVALQAFGGLRHMLVLFAIVCLVVGFSGKLLCADESKWCGTLAKTLRRGGSRVLTSRESSCES